MPNILPPPSDISHTPSSLPPPVFQSTGPLSSSAAAIVAAARRDTTPFRRRSSTRHFLPLFLLLSLLLPPFLLSFLLPPSLPQSDLLWHDHVVLSTTGHLLIPATLESRFNAVVAPILQAHMDQLWNNSSPPVCPPNEHLLVAFSLTKSASLPASLHYSRPCPQGLCAVIRRVPDLRDLVLRLPRASSRHTYLVYLGEDRAQRQDSPRRIVPYGSIVGRLMIDLSDGARLAVQRYCALNRVNFEEDLDIIPVTESNTRLLNMYELKQLFRLWARPPADWDRLKLSQLSLNPIDHSPHALSLHHLQPWFHSSRKPHLSTPRPFPSPVSVEHLSQPFKEPRLLDQTLQTSPSTSHSPIPSTSVPSISPTPALSPIPSSFTENSPTPATTYSPAATPVLENSPNPSSLPSAEDADEFMAVPEDSDAEEDIETPPSPVESPSPPSDQTTALQDVKEQATSSLDEMSNASSTQPLTSIATSTNTKVTSPTSSPPPSRTSPTSVLSAHTASLNVPSQPTQSHASSTVLLAPPLSPFNSTQTASSQTSTQRTQHEYIPRSPRSSHIGSTSSTQISNQHSLSSNGLKPNSDHFLNTSSPPRTVQVSPTPTVSYHQISTPNLAITPQSLSGTPSNGFLARPNTPPQRISTQQVGAGTATNANILFSPNPHQIQSTAPGLVPKYGAVGSHAFSQRHTGNSKLGPRAHLLSAVEMSKSSHALNRLHENRLSAVYDSAATANARLPAEALMQSTPTSSILAKGAPRGRG